MNPDLSRWLGMVGKVLVEERRGMTSTSDSDLASTDLKQAG